MRAIKEFKKNKKWSESIKNNKAPKPTSNFRFNQKGVIRHENTSTSHMDTLDIFASEEGQVVTNQQHKKQQQLSKTNSKK